MTNEAGHRYMWAMVDKLHTGAAKRIVLTGSGTLPESTQVPAAALPATELHDVIAAVKAHCPIDARGLTKRPLQTWFALRFGDGVPAQVLIEFDDECQDPYCQFELRATSDQELQNPVPGDIVSRIPEGLPSLREGCTFQQVLDDLGIAEYFERGMRVVDRHSEARKEGPVKGIVTHDCHLREGHILAVTFDYDTYPPAFRHADLVGPGWEQLMEKSNTPSDRTR